MIATAFLIAALVLFILATVGVPSPPRFNLMAGGLACWVAASLVGPLSR
jgi:hypothetical protein